MRYGFGRIILETAVGRARVGRPGVGGQGVTTRLAYASKEEQRRQRAPGRLNRVCSGLTQKVRVFVVKNASVHGLSQRKPSGQLPFLGSVAPGRLNEFQQQEEEEDSAKPLIPLAGMGGAQE